MAFEKELEKRNKNFTTNQECIKFYYCTLIKRKGIVGIHSKVPTTIH